MMLCQFISLWLGYIKMTWCCLLKICGKINDVQWCEIVILDDFMPSYFILIWVAAIMLFIDYILMITWMTCKWCK